jgi:hypothetical protein
MLFAASGMSTFSDVMFGIMFVFGYLGSPIMLIWGWARWLTQPKLRTIPAILSLISFALATAAALLAVSTIAIAQFHHFPYYDPLLLRIFRWGTLLSLGGMVVGVSGVWGRSSLRWHAPVSAAAILTFWILAASFE